MMKALPKWLILADALSQIEPCTVGAALARVLGSFVGDGKQFTSEALRSAQQARAEPPS